MSDATPLLYLKLDTATQGRVLDHSGHGNHGVLAGNAQVVADGAMGACLAIDGAGSVRVADNPSLRMPAGVTVEAWVLALGAPQRGAVVSGGQQGRGIYGLGYSTSWNFSLFYPNAGAVVEAVAAPMIAPNQWYHLAGVRASGGMDIFVHDLDGRLVAQGTNLVPANPVAFTSELFVGGSHRGRIAHVRIYDVVRTLAEIEADLRADRAEFLRTQALFATPLIYLKLDALTQGRLADHSGHANRGVPEGGAHLVSDAEMDACLAFDGAGVVRVADNPALRLSRGITVEAWVLLSEVQRQGAVIALGGDQGQGGAYGLLYLNSSWVFLLQNRATGHPLEAAAQASIDPNQWFHLAGVSTAASMDILIHDLNGRLLARGTSNAPGDPAARTSDLIVGAGHRGRIAHVRVYDVARSLAEIEWDMRADRTEFLRRRDLRDRAVPLPAQPFAGTESGQPTVLVTRTDFPAPLLAKGFALEVFIRTYDTGPRQTRPNRTIAAFNPPEGWTLALDQGVMTFAIAVTDQAPGQDGGRVVKSIRRLRESATSAARWDTDARTWHHIAVSIEPGSADEPTRYSLYKDGDCVDIHIGGFNAATVATAGRVWIGAIPYHQNSFINPFLGEISEIRIWNAPLSLRDIAIDRQRRLFADELDLVAYWPIASLQDGLFRNQVSDTWHLQPGASAPPVVPANAGDGSRLRLLPPEVIIDAATELQHLSWAAAYWRIEAQNAVDKRIRADRDLIVQQGIRETLEGEVLEAEAATESAVSAKQAELNDKIAELRSDFQTLEAKVAQRTWSFDEVISAVDGQLQEARGSVADNATHRLDSLSLDLKFIPLEESGVTLTFPKAEDLDTPSPEALGSVRIDFESREKFEASKPRLTTVPDVRGMTEALARRTLAGAGLIMEVAYSAVPVDAVAGGMDRYVGTVRGQLPAAEDEVNRNGRVTVYIGLRTSMS